MNDIRRFVGEHFTFNGVEYKVGKLLDDVGLENLYEGMLFVQISSPTSTLLNETPSISYLSKRVIKVHKFVELGPYRFMGVEYFDKDGHSFYAFWHDKAVIRRWTSFILCFLA